MDTSKHDIVTLFQQLGLPSDEKSRQAFIQEHRPLPESLALADATFWSTAQANFLREAICDDADWAAVVDKLDALLRS